MSYVNLFSYILISNYVITPIKEIIDVIPKLLFMKASLYKLGEFSIIEEEKMGNKRFENGDIVIEPIFNSNGNIMEFLEEGYARVSLHNEYLEYFEDLAKTKRTKIENTMKKREEIAEKAKVKALANKIEKESKSKK